MKTVALAVLLAATPAFAQPTIEIVPTCVAIDDELDQLPQAERPAARLLLVRALERLDQLIVDSGCQETITVSHQRDGDSVHIRLASSHARRKLTVSLRDDMLEVYGRMGKALIEAAAPEPTAALDPIEDDSAAPAIETPAVTAYEAEPPAPLKPGTWYAQFGLGVHDGAGSKGLAFGYRYGHRWKVDVGMSIASSDDATTTAFRGQVLKHKTPDARTSVYYGMGLSYASTEITMASGVSDMSGARIESTIGVEIGRTRSSRFYLESNLSIPLYLAGENYPLALVASFGAGF